MTARLLLAPKLLYERDKMTYVGSSMYESINFAVSKGIILQSLILRLNKFLLLSCFAFKPMTLAAHLINSIKHFLRPPEYNRQYKESNSAYV